MSGCAPCAMQPGEEMAVAFTINVPSDASPGHHVGGLIVETRTNEEASPSGEGETQFGVKIVQRVGVAVVIDVPGSHVAGLEITGASLRQQDDAGATFVIGVQNKQQVERLCGDRINFVGFGGNREQHLQQILAIRQIVFRIYERLADRELVRGSGNGR